MMATSDIKLTISLTELGLDDEELQTEVDKLVCLKMPEPFYAVGLWYDNFPQTSDEQVHLLLGKSTAIANAA